MTILMLLQSQVSSGDVVNAKLYFALAESPAPSFSTALIPTSTYRPPTTSSYRAPPTTSSYRAPSTSEQDDYGAPQGPVLTSSVSTGRPNTSYRPPSSLPTQATYNRGNSGTRRPDQSYSTVVDASKIKDDKIEIDINVYVNDPTSETPPSNSHGPVSTYRTPEATTGYAAPTTGYNVEVGDRPAADDYSGPQKFDDILPQEQSNSYPPNKPSKSKKKKPNYPKSYGTKVPAEDNTPYDYEAPDLYSGEGFDYLTDDIDSEYAAKPSFATYTHPEPPDLHGDYDWTTEDDHAGDHYPEPEYVIEKPHHKKHKKPHKFHKKPFHHKTPAGFHKPDPHHNPDPLGYHDSESYHHPEPIYDPDPYYDDGTYHDPKPYHEPEPYHEPDPYDIPKPYHEPEPYHEPDIYYKPDPYKEPPPYHEEPSHYEESPISYHEEPPYHSEPPYHEPEPPYHEPPLYHEPPPYHEPEPYHPPPKYDPEPHEEFYEAPPYVSEPRPRGFPHHTEELLPELRDIIRPLDWNVHDFSSWRRLLDRTKNFGGSLSNRGHHGKKLYGHYGGHRGEVLNEVYDDPYEEPVYPKKSHYIPTSKPLYREETEIPLYNPPVEHYEEPYPPPEQYEDPYVEPSPYYEEPLPYYEEPEPHYEEPKPYYEEPNPYYDRPNPYDAPLYQYDTYQPYYPPEKPPKPFDISFDNWLDSSGIDSFGVPSTTVRSYSKNPYYVAYDHIGQGQPYRPYSYSPPSYSSQVETPFLGGDVGAPLPHSGLQALSLAHHQEPAPEVVYGQPLWPDQTARPPRKVGSIWAGLAKFANSLEEKNHYRGHGTGMVSMGSEDLEYAASIERPTFMLPPDAGNITKPVLQMSDMSEPDKDPELQPQMVDRSETVDLTTNLPSSANSSGLEKAPQALPKPPAGELTFLDYLFVDDKLVGATLAKMSDMLDAYFSDR